MDDGHLVLAGLDVVQLLGQRTGLPADDRVLARLGKDEAAKPAAAIHIVPIRNINLLMRYVKKQESRLPVNVPGTKVRKVHELGREGLLALVHVVGVGELARCAHGLGVDPPQLERVVHAAGDDVAAEDVEVGAQHLVAVPLDAAEDGHAVVALHVPQAEGVILRHGQQQVRIG